MIKRFIVLLFFFSSAILFAQSLEVTVTDIGFTSAKLQSLQGEKVTTVDSITAIEKDFFRFSFKDKKFHHGFYRLAFPNNRNIDFLYDGNDVQLKTNASAILDSMEIVSSESNRLYYTFVKLNKAYKIKTDLLQLLLLRYPKEDSFYQTTQTKINQLQDNYLEFVTNTSQKEPRSFIARYIRSASLPPVNFNLSPEQQLMFFKVHALDNVDYYDAELIFSDVFTNKTIEYLTYYRNPQLPKELLEKEFMKGIDSVISHAKVNAIVYQHVVEYLLDGFKKFGFDKVLDYIVDNYVIKDDLCLEEKLGNTIQRRIDQNKKLFIGAVAPNISMVDISGKSFELYKSKKEKVLLVFYASWCPHCKIIMPQINELLKMKKNFEVVAVSLDTNREEWKKFIEKNKLNFIHVSDLKGWDGDAAKEYFIYATPTMFLLDSAKKIIAKPITFEELGITN
ncbi:MAG: TlpA family protein disulfide reductase [Ignavibacteriaceae bacterium]|nr:TlpA family protein disulfide reductase [Ignavibacteriaceae bacterium]